MPETALLDTQRPYSPGSPYLMEAEEEGEKQIIAVLGTMQALETAVAVKEVTVVQIQ